MAASIEYSNDYSLLVEREEYAAAVCLRQGQTTMRDETSFSRRRRPANRVKRQVSFSDELLIVLIPSRCDVDQRSERSCHPSQDNQLQPLEATAKSDPKEAAQLQVKLFSAMDRFKKPSSYCIAPDRRRRAPAAA
jgi:hypothetical protein